MFLENLMAFYNSHRGGINGALAGLLTAVLILLFGLFKMLFILFFTVIGYYIGKKLYEDKDYIRNLLDRILPPGTYR